MLLPVPATGRCRNRPADSDPAVPDGNCQILFSHQTPVVGSCLVPSMKRSYRNAVVSTIGLSPMVVGGVFKLLRELADAGTTVLMVEQNVKSALKISDEAVALESGRMVLQRPAAELLADPDIERLFLGSAHAAPPLKAAAS